MVSKSQIKLITSLYQKKYRNSNGLFIAEGVKLINDLIYSRLEFNEIYTIDTEYFNVEEAKLKILSETQLKKISLLKTPNKAIAVFKIPKPKPIDKKKLILVLDDIRDPGNLGTIIRLCDWFGIKDLVCSEGTVDCYNPKVVQATMGSLARVNITYLNLNDFLSDISTKIFAADMEGENIYKTALPVSGVVIMGNEANGISPEIMKMASHRITIPRFGELQQTESLNVATAAAVILSEFRRGC